MAQDSVLGLYFKTLRTHNLLEIDRFGNKLASSGLHKHTSFNNQTKNLTTECIHNESIMFYSTDPWDITKTFKNKLSRSFFTFLNSFSFCAPKRTSLQNIVSKPIST